MAIFVQIILAITNVKSKLKSQSQVNFLVGSSLMDVNVVDSIYFAMFQNNEWTNNYIFSE